MSYERNQIISLLYRIFQAERYQWFINGKYKIPTFDEIEESLERLEYSAEKSKSFIETGRLRVEYDKETQGFNYYFDLGHS